MKIRTLIAEAASLGVSVHLQHFDSPTLRGYYSQERAVIALRIGMTSRETRCTLAHEIAHLRLGHTCSGNSEERRANVMAAAMLIDAAEYARAEAINADVSALADELDVTENIVRIYQAHCLQRLGTRTYARSWRVGISRDQARQLSS